MSPLPSPRRLAAALAGAVLLFLFATAVPAKADDTLTDFYDFVSPRQRTPLRDDPRLLQASDGNFYGTSYGGDLGSTLNGAVFRLTPDGKLTTLHTFDGTDGRHPAAALIQTSDGSLYGTTNDGGVNGAGTIFRLTPDGTLTTLHAFDYDNDGNGPRTALVQGRDGNLYGVASSNEVDAGTFYRVTPDGTFTTLHRFDGREGTDPNSAPVLGEDGNFYGTMAYYGAGPGAIYRITPEGAPTLLHAFLDFSEGATPGPLLAGGDGYLYGITTGGGIGNGFGVVYRVALDGSGFSVLYAFAPTDRGYLPDGEAPINGLARDRDGNLYGVTSKGYEIDDTDFNGTLFRLAPDGTLTTMHKFKEKFDVSGIGALLLADDGRLYAVAAAGGAHGVGYVFRVTTDSVAPVVVVPPDFYLPTISGAVIRTNEISDTQSGGFQLSPSTLQPTDLKVNYKVTGTARPGVDYVALKGVAKIKADRVFKNINLFPVAIPHVPGQPGSVKTVKLTLLPGDGYKLDPAFTTFKVKITHP